MNVAYAYRGPRFPLLVKPTVGLLCTHQFRSLRARVRCCQNKLITDSTVMLGEGDPSTIKCIILSSNNDLTNQTTIHNIIVLRIIRTYIFCLYNNIYYSVLHAIIPVFFPVYHTRSLSLIIPDGNLLHEYNIYLLCLYVRNAIVSVFFLTLHIIISIF